VVAVLHDLNQAARYADHLIAMRDGRVVAAGPPREILTADLVRDVFGLDCVVVPCPVTGAPLVVPGLTSPSLARPTAPAARPSVADADLPPVDSYPSKGH
jgi:iron complex transport system ATP-binding protein